MIYISKVDECISSDLQDLGSSDSEHFIRDVVDIHTIIKFVTYKNKNKDKNRTNTSENVTSSGTNVSVKNQFELCESINDVNEFGIFGGYEKEARDALTVTLLGLGIAGNQYFNFNSHAVKATNGQGNAQLSSSSSSSIPSANDEEKCSKHDNTTNIAKIEKTELTKRIPKGIGLSASLQKSFSKELFKPPKGLLIHGPSGTATRFLPQFLLPSLSSPFSPLLLLISSLHPSLSSIPLQLSPYLHSSPPLDHPYTTPITLLAIFYYESSDI